MAIIGKSKSKASAIQPAREKVNQGMKISMTSMFDMVHGANKPKSEELGNPKFPKGVGPSDKDKLAMDDIGADFYAYANGYDYASLGYLGRERYYLGFAELARLAQISEFRMMSENLGKEATRKFVKLIYVGTDKESKKLTELNAELIKYKIATLFRKCAENDAFFGRAHIYFDIKQGNTQEPLILDNKTIAKGSLQGFRSIEPQWVMPYNYNSTDPLSADFFMPQEWYVMAKRVHRSRLLTMVSRPVPDILKPAYSFGGISLSQLALTTVNNWLRSRDSIGDIVHSFSTMILATNMQDTLTGVAGDSIQMRAQLFNHLRDTRGLMLLDKNSEELTQINTPLSGLSDLQAQAQEHMSAPSHTPLIKLLGITPSGLNASSDGEIRAFYDWILSYQEDFFTDAFQAVLEVIQLNKYGEIDPDIQFQYEPLWQMSDAEKATIRKQNIDGDVALLQEGIVSQLEVRKKTAEDPDSGYHGIDVEDVPELPEPADPANESDPASEA